MNSRTRSLLAVISAVPAALSSAAYTPADVAWLTANNSSGNPTSWIGTWQVDGASETIATIVSSQDYGVKGNRQFRPKIGTATFEGKSLSVGALDRSSGGQLILRTANDCNTTFAGEGLFLYAGSMQSWNAGNQIIRGKVTVRSPDSSPFPVTFTTAGASLDFRCPVECDDGFGLSFHSLGPSSTTQNQTNFVCRFLDNSLAGFGGELTFCPVGPTLKADASAYAKDYNSNCKPPYYITFMTGSGTMPGTLTLYPNAIVAPENATTDFSVAALNVVALGWSTNYLDVSISADASTCSLLRVTDSLSLSTPVIVRPTISADATTASAYDYGDLHLFAATNAAAATRLAVLKAPAGTTLDASLFSLERDDALPHLPLYELDVSADPSDGLSTLWLVRRPAVWAVAADDKNSSAYTAAAKWSDNATPTPANDYVALKALRTPKVTATTEQSFPGHSLTIVNGIAVSAQSPVIRFDDLRIFKRGILENLNNPSTALNILDDGPGLGTFALNGRIRLHTPVESSPDTTAFQITCYANKAWTINAEISGEGTLYLRGCVAQNNVANRNARYALLGLNTNYYGTIHMNSVYSADDGTKNQLLINDPRNLGAPLPEFRQNALILSVNCALRPLVSLTLEDDNRGISLTGSRTFFTVPDGLTLTCRKRINYGGGLAIKDGAGELALGGSSPTFDGGATPAAGKNVLDVREGTLCPVSAEAFQGLAVVITNSAATLAVNVPASNSDGGIGQFGMLGTSWETPLTVPATGLTVLVRDPDGVLSGEVPGPRPRYAPVITVGPSAKAALDGKLSVRSSVGFPATPVWLENEDGSYTFAADLRFPTILSLR
ncbi:MAG: hypothetical protein IKH04_08485 [Kiritimatiellae bacterium]|nr:hypothetical protein [Kiritimatiellia bacterium]